MSRHRSPLHAIGMVGTFIVGLLCASGFAADPPEVINLKTSPQADERLFLLAAAARFHEVLAAAESHDQEAELKAIQERAQATRKKALRLKVHIEQEKLDAELIRVYQDVLDTADAYADFAAQVEKIIRQARGAGERGAGEAIGKGLQDGMGAAGGAQQAGAKGGDAAAVGFIVGVLRAAIEANKADERIREQVTAAMNKQVKTITDQTSLTAARLQNTAAVLTKRHAWKPNETGIEGPTRLKDIPRNPIGQVGICRQFLAENDVDKARAAAVVCEEAVRLVPDGTLYDEYRLDCLRSAADLRFRVVDVGESAKGLFRGVRNADAARAVALYDACLRYSADADGAIRSRKAKMLGADNQMRDALGLAAEVAKLNNDDAAFAYSYACLLSSTGDTDSAFSWFNLAIRQGLRQDIAWSRKDPDLARMRAARQKDFDALMAVKFDWDVKFGFFNDDFVLTNTSAFALTDVRITVRLVQGNQTWNLNLQADRIEPGARELWENVVSIPGDRLDRAKCSVTVSCREQ